MALKVNNTTAKTRCPQPAYTVSCVNTCTNLFEVSMNWMIYLNVYWLASLRRWWHWLNIKRGGFKMKNCHFQNPQSWSPFPTLHHNRRSQCLRDSTGILSPRFCSNIMLRRQIQTRTHSLPKSNSHWPTARLHHARLIDMWLTCDPPLVHIPPFPLELFLPKTTTKQDEVVHFDLVWLTMIIKTSLWSLITAPGRGWTGWSNVFSEEETSESLSTALVRPKVETFARRALHPAMRDWRCLCERWEARLCCSRGRSILIIISFIFHHSWTASWPGWSLLVNVHQQLSAILSAACEVTRLPTPVCFISLSIWSRPSELQW